MKCTVNSRAVWCHPICYLLVLSEQRLAQKDRTQVQIHHTPSNTDSWNYPTVETCELNSESSNSLVLCCVPHLFSSRLLSHGPPRRNMYLSFFYWHLLESQAPTPVHMRQHGSAGYSKGYRMSWFVWYYLIILILKSELSSWRKVKEMWKKNQWKSDLWDRAESHGRSTFR